MATTIATSNTRFATSAHDNPIAYDMTGPRSGTAHAVVAGEGAMCQCSLRSDGLTNAHR